MLEIEVAPDRQRKMFMVGQKVQQAESLVFDGKLDAFHVSLLCFPCTMESVSSGIQCWSKS